jgi:hypothetical protein
MTDSRFIPIPLIRANPIDPATAIPEAAWTEADREAIRTVHTLYDEIDGMRSGYDRSRQNSIGPSEIGMECDLCFMRKMAELPKNANDDGSWKTQVGTYVHAGLERDFDAMFGDLGTRISEGELLIDEYAGRLLRGHCDMFVPNLPQDFSVKFEPSDYDGYDGTDHSVRAQRAEHAAALAAAPGIVVDWKIPSTDEDANGKLKPSTTMQKTVNGNLKREYVVQSMLYARGWVRLGYNVTHVVIYYIPSFGQLWHAKPVIMRYSPEWAAWGVQRWRSALDARNVFMGLGATEEEAWQQVIAAQRKASFCFSCKGYEELEQNAGGLAIFKGLK